MNRTRVPGQPLDPLRSPEDLKHHVLLVFEPEPDGHPRYDWDRWFGAIRVRRIRGAGWLHADARDDAAPRRGADIATRLPVPTRRTATGRRRR